MGDPTTSRSRWTPWHLVSLFVWEGVEKNEWNEERNLLRTRDSLNYGERTLNIIH